MASRGIFTVVMKLREIVKRWREPRVELAEGLHKGGDVIDDTMPRSTEPVPWLDGP